MAARAAIHLIQESSGEPIMKQLITIFACIGLVCFSIASVQAETRLFTQSVTYQSGSQDNAFSSEVIARAQAKQAILERMAAASESLSKRYKFPFSRESSIPLFSCMVDVKTAKGKWKNGKYYLKARTRTDMGAILADLGTFGAKKIPTQDIYANYSTGHQALEEIEAMNGNPTDPSGKAGRQEAYDKAINTLHAVDWYGRARFAGFSGDLDGAIEAYAKAIEYNPELADAYRFRGQLYIAHLKDRKKGVTDLGTAMDLYFKDAVGHRKSKAYQKCVDSLDTILGIDSKNPDAYYQRAACNVGLKQQDKAKEDFQTAARLGHEKARGLLTAKGMTW